ncbi:YdeI/OmpD-associated family protein [Psychromarinibacter sp. C21-152]|uniref:YdeI/OmpD-associated family protein n=1 Tax=Psychromarinibacter sediminicola TaxID=3033385 RepID=A0AAE3T7X8_9RHOB|nr:YdeI/OmpD-associated family protein [Psychromarinibacter sediminicola]MDF0600652.1 YdeI/OmpD-associated family protein [Psychromarinibacter sediminicola]
MGERNPRFDRFFDRDTPWKAEKKRLREIVLDHPLTEELKWRQPVYCHAGGNVATIDGLKDRCVLSFFKGALLTDPEGMLEPPGPNSRSARYAPFTSLEEIDARADALHAYLDEAIENEKRGLSPEMPPDDLDLPEELAAALDADPALAEAWAALTPGRRRGWVIHVSGAKQAKTRTARVEKAAPRIRDGKGFHDR